VRKAIEPTDVYSRHLIPAVEMERTTQLIRSHPSYASTRFLIETYARLGLKVVPDPHGRDVADLVAQALQTAMPLSVIRLGDGEMNILATGIYDTPYLDRFCFAASVEGQEDRFIPDELWMLALREMMMSAVLQADIVGVLGIWHWKQSVDPTVWPDNFVRDPRGTSGYWRGMDYVLKLARAGLLQDKVLASAHLYFGLLNHLDEIFRHANHVLLITNKVGVLEGLRNKFPCSTFDLLSVGIPKNSDEPLAESPRFLEIFASQLPRDLRGCCCLVGAGLWAELYCSWIKQRGGVAVDIGSGFDLLNGTISRPIHTIMGFDQKNPYAL
jgi:hypothetical protein